MSGPDFLDTNILVYAYDSADITKQAAAQNLLRRALQGEALAELAATLLHKASPRAKPEEAIQILETLTPIGLIRQGAGMVRRAVEARIAYGVHFYDGMIIAAAERGGCSRIWSEDFNEGQKYFGISAQNPFR